MGGWWAWQNGKLDGLLERLGLAGTSSPAPTTGKDSKDDDNSVSPWWPISSDNLPSVGGGNPWESVLRRNWAVVSPWAKANYGWVAAMIKQESGSQGSAARGSAGEVGLMQVKPGTALDLYSRLGYRQFPATTEALATDAGGIYFGTSYLQYLSTIRADRAWITKAYNGGPGWEGLSDSYRAARETYYSEVLDKFRILYPGVI
ncbi:transglycosylase SLT domain-containing protein [Neotabrizicola shimadae]|uniref:Transglycosylase SLT domain-containing protein n=1 Tax=Neotabrizicola shimadae TaxID=2807096 RepID=A0A8G0ZYI0_9RHOB|nr:transglycosylase SLT domain-containing protein [Neotabrizicola shimadae]QYZ71220.1 transglycosylase SLT domain-containing protein [Neotabrizicola shimadae]